MSYQANSSDETVVTVKVVSSKIVLTPKKAGEATVIVTVTDSEGASDTKSFKVKVTHINHAPVYNGESSQFNFEDASTVNIDLNQYFSDPDGDQLSYAIEGLPKDITLNKTSGLISGRLSSDASKSSPYNIIVTVSDSNGAQIEKRFTLIVENIAPKYRGDLEDINSVNGANLVLDISKSFYDPDGDILSFMANGLPEGLQIDSSKGVISGTLASDANLKSPYNITLTVKDGDGGSVDANFSIIVLEKGLIAIDDTISTLENRPVALYPYRNDLDPDKSIDISTVALESLPKNGNAFVDFNGTVVYLPKDNFVGVEKFTYRVCDKSEQKRCSSAEITVEVNATDSNNVATNWGFNEFSIPNNSVTLTPKDSLQRAIDNLKSQGGGTIKLSEGTFYVKNIRLASNIVIEGAGINKTILKTYGNGLMMESRDNMENIIVRNLTADCRNNGDYGCLEFNYGTHNVLIENIHVFGATRNNIIAWNEDWSSAGNFTIRNVISHDTVLWHGIALRFIKGAVVSNNLVYKVGGDGIDMSRVHYGEVVNNNVYDTGYGVKFPGSDYIYMHDNYIEEVWVEGGIKFNPMSNEYNNEHFHLENNVLVKTKGGIIDWGDSAPSPHFAEFVSRNNSVINDYWNKNMVRVANGIALYDYGDNVKNREGETITDEFEIVVRKSKDKDPYDSDGVGYKSWEKP